MERAIERAPATNPFSAGEDFVESCLCSCTLRDGGASRMSIHQRLLESGKEETLKGKEKEEGTVQIHFVGIFLFAITGRPQMARKWFGEICLCWCCCSQSEFPIWTETFEVGCYRASSQSEFPIWTSTFEVGCFCMFKATITPNLKSTCPNGKF